MGMLIAAMALAAAQAGTQPATSSGEHRLTPEQIEAVLADAAKKREASERQSPAPIDIADLEPLRAPQVHGEFGIGAGTGGYREIFGTSIVPLGTSGGAAFSFDFVDFGNQNIRRDRY